MAEELELGELAADIRVRGSVTPAAELPIAEVLVDNQVPHLARPFDYAVPAEMDADALPGVRVRVVFAGRLTSGFILSRKDTTDHVGELVPIKRITSNLVVLRPELLSLCEHLAARYAGTLHDVLRLAIPPRHAATEQSLVKKPAGVDEAALDQALAELAESETEPLVSAETEFLTALEDWDGEGPGPRAAYAVLPGSDPVRSWIHTGLRAARRVLAQGRSVLWLVPDEAELQSVMQNLGPLAPFAVNLSATMGQAARWRAWASALTGRTRLVIGTRAAAYVPMEHLGLIICFADGDDSYVEPRAPYCHARQVLLERIQQSLPAALFIDHSRTVEIQRLVETSWLGEITPTRTETRTHAPLVLDQGPVRGPEDYSRLPSRAYDMLRTALGRGPAKAQGAAGPVLVQVPRTGYITLLSCTHCRETLRCPQCAHPLHAQTLSGPFACKNCGWRSRYARCGNCGNNQFRSSLTGATRIHQDLGRAFPGIKVVRSAGEHIVREIDDSPQIVVATTGAEPLAPAGYAAAILMDTLWPGPGLRSTDKAIARRLRAAALVRSQADGGRVLLLDRDPHVEVTVTRWQPTVWAHQQLADRTGLGLPPSVRTIELIGPRAAVAEVLAVCRDAGEVTVFEERPVLGEDSHTHLILGVTYSSAPQVTVALAAATASRSLNKEPQVRVRVDYPDAL